MPVGFAEEKGKSRGEKKIPRALPWKGTGRGSPATIRHDSFDKKFRQGKDRS